MEMTEALRAVGPLVVGAIDAGEPTKETLDLVRAGALGGFTLFRRNIDADLNLLRRRNVALHAAAPRPLIIAIDQEGGRVARLRESPIVQLPSAAELAERFSERSLAALGAEVGAQLRALGFTMNFAPVLDLHSEATNPVIGDRAFGVDAEKAVVKALAFARGMRSAGLGTCGKHFPGHGATTVDSHLALPYVDAALDVLQRREFAPFRIAAAEGLDAFMSAHVVYRALDSLPATLSKAIASSLLRDAMGFRGVLFSDDLRMKALAGTPDETAVAAIAAGCDAVLVCEDEGLVATVVARLAKEFLASDAFRVRCNEARARVDNLAESYRASPAADEPTLGAQLRKSERDAVSVLWGSSP